jgi:hypothetical protein
MPVAGTPGTMPLHNSRLNLWSSLVVPWLLVSAACVIHRYRPYSPSTRRPSVCVGPQRSRVFPDGPLSNRPRGSQGEFVSKVSSLEETHKVAVLISFSSRVNVPPCHRTLPISTGRRLRASSSSAAFLSCTSRKLHAIPASGVDIWANYAPMRTVPSKHRLWFLEYSMPITHIPRPISKSAYYASSLPPYIDSGKEFLEHLRGGSVECSYRD